VVLAALAGEIERNGRALDGDVAVAHRGQPVGVIGFGILRVADANGGRLQQTDDRRQHLGPGQAGQRQVALYLCADLRQGVAEEQHAFVLGLVADLAPARMIAALLARPGIAPGGLQVAVGIGADPHPRPGRRDDQRADSRQSLGVVYGPAIGADIAESAAKWPALDAGFGVRYIVQARRFGVCDRIEFDFDRGPGALALRFRRQHLSFDAEFAACGTNAKRPKFVQ
jgi:hypothetical protein